MDLSPHPPRPLMPPPSRLDRLLGLLALALWRIAGAVVLMGLLAHPRGRARALRSPAPPPGLAWVHGASHGEQAISRAIRPLFDEGVWPTATRSPVEGALPAPLDLPWVFESWLRRARPSRLVLIEAELWPGWLAACRRHCIPVLLVAPRERRGLPRWRRAGPLGRAWLQGVQVLPAASTGDLKALDPRPVDGNQGLPFAIIGLSLRTGDAARLTAAWDLLAPPRPPLVLGPRHADGIAEAQATLGARGMRPHLASSGPAPADAHALILDQMGAQAGAAAQAQVALVGGSFDPEIGAHSPHDALRAGVPVVVGPHLGANAIAMQAGLQSTPPRVWRVDDTPPAIAAGLAHAIAQGRCPPPLADRAALDTLRTALPPPRLQPERPPRPWLRPLQPAWAWGVQVHKKRAGTPAAPPLPVVVVGGITTGGSGKTPAVGHIAARLPGCWVGARGVGRPAAGPRLRHGLPEHPPPWGLGDEPEMMRRRGFPAMSCPDKPAMLRAAAAAGATALVLDDGLQSWTVGASLRVGCVDMRRPTGGGLLPAGDARQPLAALELVDLLWLYQGVALDRPSGAPTPGLPKRPARVHAWARPTGWRWRGSTLPLTARTGAVDVAVGIAHNGDFLALLLDLGLRPRQVWCLPDHGPLPPLPDGCVVSEKDAARAPPTADLCTLVLGLVLDDGDNDLLDAMLTACTTEIRTTEIRTTEIRTTEPCDPHRIRAAAKTTPPPQGAR